MEVREQLLDTWRINDRLNLFFLQSLSEDALKLKAEKAKSVAGQFAHIHNVRRMWLKAAAPGSEEAIPKLEDSAGLEELRSALSQSGKAVEDLLATSIDSGRVKNFKPHPVAFLGYLISHESNHRAQAELILRQCGQPLPDKVGYGLWEWGVR